MPTLPALSRTNFTALAESLAKKMAGNLVTLAAGVSEKAVSAVRLVLLAIAVTVLVSALTVMRSPTTNCVRNRVPVPTRVVLAVGSAVPVRVEEAAPVNRPEPATSSLRRGAAVPMPTLPPAKMAA